MQKNRRMDRLINHLLKRVHNTLHSSNEKLIEDILNKKYTTRLEPAKIISEEYFLYKSKRKGGVFHG